MNNTHTHTQILNCRYIKRLKSSAEIIINFKETINKRGLIYRRRELERGEKQKI